MKFPRATHLVALHPDRTTLEKIKEIANQWLADMGLELKPSKTRITHTLEDPNGTPGFDFLGFNICQYRVGKTHSGRTPQGKLLGFKTIIRPSDKAIQRHTQTLQEVIRLNRNSPQVALIARLNPIIQGWTNYYATVSASKTFNKMTYLTYQKLRYWAKRRHPNWSMKRIVREYWRLEKGQWDFAPREGLRLYEHRRTHIIRHAKVKGAKSPYDGDWTYWATRLGRYPELPRRVATLLHRQEGKCPWCGLYFKNDDEPEIDHILPKSQGGMDTYANWQLLHRHCHDRKTARDNLPV